MFLQTTELYLVLPGVTLLLLEQVMVISHNLAISFVIFKLLLVNKWEKNLK